MTRILGEIAEKATPVQLGKDEEFIAIGGS